MCIALFHFKTCVVALLYSTGVSFVWIRARLCVVLLLVLGLSKYMDDEMDAGLEPPIVLMTRVGVYYHLPHVFFHNART